MLYGAFRLLADMLSICVIFAGAFLDAICPVDEIVGSGRVENAPAQGGWTRAPRLLRPSHLPHAESRSCADWCVPGKVRPQTKNCGLDPNRG
jgi:hypothetical protein